jgi:IS6 family transposase
MATSQPVDFKWHYFYSEVILQCMRWYCRYGISYRYLEEMMAECKLAINRKAVNRWVQH